MSTLANLYNDLKTLCSQWFYTKAEIDTNKQDKLISGSNLKTINNESLLGSGNISIQGGGSITVDDALSSTSENPVQNKVITGALNSKSDTGHTHTISNITDLTVETETIAVTSATTGNNYFSGGTREITAKRYGKVVMVYVNFYGVNAKQDSTYTDTTIGTLPNGWKPATTVHTHVGQSGSSNLTRASMSINTSGEIKIRLVYSSALTNVGLRTTLTFIAE